MRTCSKCGQLKAENDFYEHKDGYVRTTCKKCQRAHQRSLRAAKRKRLAKVIEPISWKPPGKDTIIGQIQSLPKGHPTRELYFRNRIERAMESRAMERWARNGFLEPY